jgi:hypothetical protein
MSHITKKYLSIQGHGAHAIESVTCETLFYRFAYIRKYAYTHTHAHEFICFPQRSICQDEAMVHMLKNLEQMPTNHGCIDLHTLCFYIFAHAYMYICMPTHTNLPSFFDTTTTPQRHSSWDTYRRCGKESFQSFHSSLSSAAARMSMFCLVSKRTAASPPVLLFLESGTP